MNLVIAYHRTVGTMPLAKVAVPSVRQIWSRNSVQS